MTAHHAPAPLERAAISDPRWLALVESDSMATPFHQPAWSRLLERCYGYRPFVLAETAPDGTFRAALPFVEVSGPARKRRWISLPFSDYCPPLGSCADSEAFPRQLALVRKS